MAVKVMETRPVRAERTFVKVRGLSFQLVNSPEEADAEASDTECASCGQKLRYYESHKKATKSQTSNHGPHHDPVLLQVHLIPTSAFMLVGDHNPLSLTCGGHGRSVQTVRIRLARNEQT